MGAGSGFSGKGAVPMAPSATALAPPVQPQAGHGASPQQMAPGQFGAWLRATHGGNQARSAMLRAQQGGQWQPAPGAAPPAGDPGAMQAIAQIITGGPHGR